MRTGQRLLFIFPHPDDETYGCGGTIPKYVSEGADVFLLTLTKGEASSQGPKRGYTRQQFGEIRAEEMRRLAAFFGLRDFFQKAFPDGTLAALDPRVLEDAVREIIEAVRPQVVVSYPPHGVSGFLDHIVTHAIVKRVFVQLRETLPGLQRFAMQTVDRATAAMTDRPLRADDAIDCVIDVSQHVETKRGALAIQDSIRDVSAHDITHGLLTRTAEHFQFWQERYDPSVDDLFFDLSLA